MGKNAKQMYLFQAESPLGFVSVVQNPKKPRVLSARPKTWPAVGDMESETGEERGGREGRGRAGLRYGTANSCVGSRRSAFTVAETVSVRGS